MKINCSPCIASTKRYSLSNVRSDEFSLAGFKVKVLLIRSTFQRISGIPPPTKTGKSRKDAKDAPIPWIRHWTRAKQDVLNMRQGCIPVGCGMCRGCWILNHTFGGFRKCPWFVSLGNYRPQRSCGQGNIFTPVCHSVHGGGGGVDGIPQGTEPVPPGPDTPPPPDQAHPPSPREADSGIRSTSGRYASYWNTFLLITNLSISCLFVFFNEQKIGPFCLCILPTHEENLIRPHGIACTIDAGSAKVSLS